MEYVYLSPLIIGNLLGLSLVIIFSLNRSTPASRYLGGLVCGALLWGVCYVLEILAPSLEAKLLWAKIKYFGVVVIPLAWYLFADQHLSPQGRSARTLRSWLLLVIPLITLLLLWTNDFHSLVWRAVRTQESGPLLLLEFERGPWAWFFVFYSYALITAGTVQLVLNLRQSAGGTRKQLWWVLLAALSPLLIHVLSLMRLTPLYPLDWTPFSITVSAVLFTVGLFHFRFINILPIAQKTVFASMTDCCIILDKKNLIIDLNASAEALIGEPCESLLGRPLERFLPEIAHWVGKAGMVKECQVEIVQGQEPAQRFYDLNISILNGLLGRPVGRLVVLHEITLLVQEQARLETARAHLEEVVAERTETLRQTVEQLQQELIQHSLMEQRFEEVVEASPDAILLIDHLGLIKLVNVQAERLFGYGRADLLERNIEILLPDPRLHNSRNLLMRPAAQFGIQPVSDPLELEALCKDGRTFPAEISLGTLHKDNAVWVACNVREITQRKQAEFERSRLMQELQNSHEQLRALTFRLQEVREMERRQIASELHDQVGQNLTGLSLNLQIVENSLCDNPNPTVRSRLQDSLKLVEETTRKVRDVMADLHPPVLDESGLVSALSWYSTQYSRRTGLDIQVNGEPIEPRLPLDVEMALFRLAQEALNNVAKHAQASLVEITVESTDHTIRLTVRDDGNGFDPQTLNVPSAQPHWGFLSMEQRAASIGGQLTIESAPGRGTSITIRVKKGEVHDQSISGR